MYVYNFFGPKSQLYALFKSANRKVNYMHMIHSNNRTRILAKYLRFMMCTCLYFYWCTGILIFSSVVSIFSIICMRFSITGNKALVRHCVDCITYNTNRVVVFPRLVEFSTAKSLCRQDLMRIVRVSAKILNFEMILSSLVLMGFGRNEHEKSIFLVNNKY